MSPYLYCALSCKNSLRKGEKESGGLVAHEIDVGSKILPNEHNSSY